MYSKALGATCPSRCLTPSTASRVVFVTLPNTKIELLEPLGDDSPIAEFLERNPGGRHPSHLL